MKNIKLVKYITTLLIFIFAFNIYIYADTNTVVTLANDLNESQRTDMLNLFNVSENEVSIIGVTNEEERAYLEGIAPEEQIGQITISSAYVEIIEDGSGIDVETYNISWVTKEMYQSALVTAGVKDAKVIAAAPYPVSGTGALTGIIKAFEKATGQKISNEQKKIANEEIVQTGKLGDEIGKEKATELITIIKEKVVEKSVDNKEDIKRIVVDIAGELDINLNTNQIEDITNLMDKINNLNLNTEEIRNQLEGIGDKIDQALRDNEEVKSLLQRIIDMIKELFNSLFGLFTNK